MRDFWIFLWSCTCRVPDLHAMPVDTQRRSPEELSMKFAALPHDPWLVDRHDFLLST